MKYPKIYLLLLLITLKGLSQNSPEYTNLISQGWQLCLKKDFTNSATLYEKAFKISKNIPLKDRYNASCIYALAKNNNMAFHHLFIIGNQLKWTDFDHLTNDSDLIGLHKDHRWQKLCDLIAKNKKEKESHFDMAMVATLDQIYFDDQNNRSKIRSTEEKYGRGSKEMDELWQDILKKDALNLEKVSKILDEKGWPDKASIGERGTSTLFLVIQHANQEAQEKYLPLIKKAMVDNNLPKRQYAMFYDRLLLRRGERQIYGTQLAMDKVSKLPYVLPLESPEKVDERRSKMGLNSMQENLNRWNMKWNVDEYLKILPSLEAKEKELNSKKQK